MGFELREGKYDKNILSEDEMWATVNWLFSTHSKNETSYKFLFFKSVIDCFNQMNTDYIVSFQTVFSRFAELSWNIIIKYGIRQKATTSDHKECVLEQILHDYYMVILEEKYTQWNEIADGDRVKLCKKVKSACKRYVVGALYSDMNGKFYSFNKKEEWMELNPIMVNFINRNRIIIENLNFYKWSKFYEEVNDKETEKKLARFLDNGFIRKNESIYRSVLAYEFERISDDVKIDELPNTFEILLDSEKHKENDDSEKNIVVSIDNYEDEMYDSFEKMKEYLKDPILLINNLKRRNLEKEIVK